MTRINVIRRGLQSPYIQPTSIRLSPASFGITDSSQIRRGRLRVPGGWRVESPSPLAWFLTPTIDLLDFDIPNMVLLEVEFNNGTSRSYGRLIGVELDVQTTFIPERHAWPERNSASVLGEIGPTLEPFLETFRLPTRPAARLLFRGLYSDIVQLRTRGVYRGGLCSGMARWAGVRALSGQDAMPARDQALYEIKRMHGRQLTDRALLSSFGWFLRASPTAAYRTVRDEALATGQSLRAFDVGVPKPWRRDILTAIVREGHTIVPYRIRQPNYRRAYVDCYDPNRGQETHTIEFHLDTGRYAYRNLVRFEDDGVGLVAVKHETYARPGTAILATLGSMFWLLLGLRTRAGSDQRPQSGEPSPSSGA